MAGMRGKRIPIQSRGHLKLALPLQAISAMDSFGWVGQEYYRNRLFGLYGQIPRPDYACRVMIRSK